MTRRMRWAVALFLASGAALAASPDPFTFIERTNVATNVVVTSEAKTLTGFTDTLPVSITVANGAQYSVNGSAYTSIAGSIASGQTLRVRHVSAPSASTAVITTVTVGDYSTEFKSVTGTADRTPEPFTFGNKAGVEPSTLVESGPVTLSGYNAPIPVAAGPGAEYQIGGGSWTSATGTLAVDQTLRIRHTSNAQFLAYTKTYVKAGNVTGYFTTRTREENPPPPDADGDGIVDAFDQCPQTPAGGAVHFNGCADSQLDSDADGVSDAADQCPNTTTGAAVNATGCATSQLDADGDGVSDAADQCPGTRAGTAVDANGCPISPDYADLCESYGIGGSEPVCEGLRELETELESQCEDNGGPDGFCSLAGGNLNAVIETCYGSDSPAPDGLCRGVEAFVDGAAGWCRQVSNASGGAQRHEFCALIGGVLISEGELRRYEASWAHRALLLQNRLGYRLPMIHNTLLHTHNSFNAQDDNTPSTLSGSDFNQYYDIPDQLRMDIRAVEMDVHWAPGRDASVATRGREPMLCHGLDGSQFNVGCTTEKPLREGLAEFRAWLDAHPDEVVMLYIEDDITGTQPASDQPLAYATTAQVVEDQIGERVFRPADHSAACDAQDNAAVPSSWLNVSRQAILDAGKQVLLITETCRGDSPGWNALFHQKNDDNWQQGTQSSYAGKSYATGADECVFRDDRRREWTRVWEDSTVVTATAGGGAPGAVTPAVMRELVRCGLNMPGLDRLYPADGRLAAAVWSWAKDQPASDPALNCALHGADSRFVAADCAQARPYACVGDDNPDSWRVAGGGAWADGAAACPAGSHFSVPANGYANEKLREAKAAVGAREVWLNYSDVAHEGAWIGDATAAPPVTAGAPAPTFDVCDPVAESACVSDVPVFGPALLAALAPVLGPDPHPFAPLEPLLEACRDNGVPDALCARAEDVAGDGGLSRWVDPRIGSYPPGFTNPGPVAPWGMVALGPDTEGPIVYGGYYQHNSLITGFSHVHMSAGVYKGGYIPVLPFTGGAPERTDLFQGQDHPVPAYASAFDHATESADAGYYAVTLARYGVFAELTATERAGLHRYIFNDPAQPPRVLIDVSRTLGGYRDGAVSLRADGALVGHVDRGGFKVYFSARVGAPFTATTFDGTPVEPGAPELSGGDLGVILDFAGATQPILVKVGISYTDEAGALANLDAEIPGWDFDAVRAATRSKWDEALAAIEVEGGTLAERISFYTALYRLQHFPNLHNDVDGRYRGPDGNIHSDTRPHYSQFSSWDSYRGQNQMQAEIVPERYDDMVRSLLAFHQQTGFLPRWQEGPRDSSHMSGDPIVPFVGEAWCRGALDEQLRADLWPALTNLPARRDAELAQLGYLSVGRPEPYFEAPDPFARLNDVQAVIKQVEGGSGRAGTTLEYGIADFSLALMAQSAGADAAGIAERSLNYRNLLDPETGWIRPRHSDRSWLTPFAPELGYGFQEGTSWQYSWLAMHDYAGVIERMGGEDEVNLRLDQFFNLPASMAPIAWPTAQNQITAFGIAYYGNQYAPGNEHDLEAPYVYNYSGEPWKAQAVARAAASIYTPTPNGLPGNDDLGALSGWLLWTMSGLYPINPGTPLVVVGSPVFEKVTIRRPGGDLVVEAPGASAVNKYVQAVAVDGAAATNPWMVLPRAATTVRIEMGPAPNLEFGAAPSARPPSFSTHALPAFGCKV